MTKNEFKAGDKIRLILSKKEYEGILIESYEKGIYLLKLDSGYNIGINKKDVFDIELIEKSGDENNLINKKEKKDASKPNIGMIITGGTIAARLNPKKGGVDWLTDPKSLFRFYPDVFEKVNISKVEVPFMKASEDMDYKDWQKIAKTAEQMLNEPDIKGIIITHGTDFLHYTSASLGFMLNSEEKLNKPVVLTYSQRSVDRASSDANLNLKCSALAAISDIAEVMLVGHASSSDDYCYAMPGTKVRKLHSSKRDAFKVVNDKPIAKIYEDKVELLDDYNLRNKQKVKADIKFQEKIALVKFYPGQTPEILDFYLKQGYKGIVIEMGGLGHVATSRARNSWIQKLKDVQKKGLVICATAQTVYGRLDPLVYSNGRDLLETGIIYLEDMLSETAFVKLGWVLGHKDWAKDFKKVKEKMLENIAGEFNNRLEE
ncbi:MAG: Glu-tRNA(Gln) amidotransferase subunit GatD [Minisyncoccales bacterium]